MIQLIHAVLIQVDLSDRILNKPKSSLEPVCVFRQESVSLPQGCTRQAVTLSQSTGIRLRTAEY
jgi:hypothetical protein